MESGAVAGATADTTSTPASPTGTRKAKGRRRLQRRDHLSEDVLPTAASDAGSDAVELTALGNAVRRALAVSSPDDANGGLGIKRTRSLEHKRHGERCIAIKGMRMRNKAEARRAGLWMDWAL